MDRRVLIVSLVLFAGGAAGIGVAVFAFVGIDDATTATDILWTSEPAGGDDGSGAVVATVDGDPMIIQATGNGDAVGLRALDATGDVAWARPVPPDSAGDETQQAGTLSALTTGMFDGEPVVAGTTDTGTLVGVAAADGSERLTVSLAGSSGIEPTFGDVTGDGTPELIAVTDDGTVVAVDTSGDVVFDVALDGEVSLRPLAVVGPGAPDSNNANGDADMTAIADTLTETGIAVVHGSAGDQTISVIDGTGEIAWTAGPETTVVSWNTASTRRGDVVALGGADGTLRTLEVLDGSLRYDVGLQDVPVGVGEADAGRIHVGGTGDVWAVDSLDGEVVWKQQYGAETRVNAPTLGDVTGDGTREILVVNRGGEVLGMNRNGEPVLRGSAGDVVVYGSPLMADLTDSGHNEVVVVTDDGTAIALSG